MGSKRPPFRVRKRRMRRRRKRLTVVANDVNRVPFPGIAYHPNRARFFLTAAGRVYRDDGRLLIPLENLRVRLSTITRSLPLAVAQAFGHQPPDHGYLWRPWVDPVGPIDRKTGRRRCSIADVVYVPHSELVRYGMTGIRPTTFFPLL